MLCVLYTQVFCPFVCSNREKKKISQWTNVLSGIGYIHHVRIEDKLMDNFTYGDGLHGIALIRNFSSRLSSNPIAMRVKLGDQSSVIALYTAREVPEVELNLRLIAKKLIYLFVTTGFSSTVFLPCPFFLGPVLISLLMIRAMEIIPNVISGTV